MATSSGPGAVNSGLVFAYDMANYEKSWRGEPTTNLYDFSFYQAEGGHTATRTVGDAPGLSTSVVDYHTITTSGSWINESARLIIWPTTALAASTTFRVSFWARVTSKETTTIKSAFYGNAVNNSHSLTTSWQRFSYSSTTHSAYRALEFGSDDGAITFQIAGIQWESKSVQTPYVKTSRSNTQAILDLTGQNTITANSLTYNADGTFTFATGVNYCTVSSLDSLIGDVTLEAVVDLGTANGPHQTAICTDLGYRYGIKLLASYHGNMAAWAGFGSTDYLVSGSNIQSTGNNHICLTRSSSTGLISLYRNGILVATGTGNTGNMSSAGSAQGRLGLEYHSGSYGFNGKINFARAYSRVLTADEIAQNFAATRSRYGI